MKRRIEMHEECLKAFASELKREIKMSLAAWQTLDPQQAAGRRSAYSSIIFLLKQQAEAHEIPLPDLGLAGYEVPQLPE
jgi:hypothetical protein